MISIKSPKNSCLQDHTSNPHTFTAAIYTLTSSKQDADNLLQVMRVENDEVLLANFNATPDEGENQNITLTNQGQ